MQPLALRLLAAAALVAPLSLFAQNKPSGPIKWDTMDLGPFHSGTFKVKDQPTAKGIAIKVGGKEAPATVLFDTELLRVSAAWTGGFITFPRARGGLEGQIAPAGEVQFSTGYAPGWAVGDKLGEDTREKHQGHLAADAAKWRGLYVHGDQVVLSYNVGKSNVLELDSATQVGGSTLFRRTFELSPSDQPRTLLVGEVNAAPKIERSSARVIDGERATVFATLGYEQGKFAVESAGGAQRVVLQIPPTKKTLNFTLQSWSGAAKDAPSEMTLSNGIVPTLSALTKGGPSQWRDAIQTKGVLGEGAEAYVADEITLPEENPYHSWLRPGGHDFLPDGTAVLVNLSGDVWLVSGLDEKLEHVKWKRFASGLFQPLGCKVVDDKIYVTCRDQITRLSDLNGDGEADFYECFNNDCVVVDNYHEFALDLQTDSKGNFFYAKGSPWTPTNVSPHQGTMLKLSKDGSKLEVYATGLRAPNGLGMGPKDTLTFSDNQGHWMPANRLNIVKEGGFYGMTPAAHRTLTFKKPDGTEFSANPSDAAARADFKTEFWGNAQTPLPTKGYDLPLCWVPMEIDNSSGGQVWVPPGEKWGPLGGRMLFMSYGKCSLFNVLREDVGGVEQGGLCRFPLKFKSGIMRGRFSPVDGQLYVSGLNVWQSNASKDGCFYRVRYTGKPVVRPVELHAAKNGIAITFTAPLDEKSATDAQNFAVQQWNYAWTGAYGSPDISVADPTKKQRDTLEVKSVKLSPDKKTLTLELPDVQPVMQMKIKFKINAADGQVLEQEIHNTIHKVAGS